MFAWIMIVGAAQAQEEACGGVLPRTEWDEALDAIDAAMADGNGARAERILDDVHDAARCAGFVLTPADVGRLARQEALLAYYVQDQAQLELWAQLAGTLLTDGWEADLPVPDTFVAAVRSVAPPTTRTLDGQGLAPPKKGAILLDGRLILEPTAAVSVPHLVQVLDKDGEVVLTRWQDGVAFAEDLLGPDQHLSAPKWYTPPPEPVADPPAVADADPPAVADTSAPAPAPRPPPKPAPPPAAVTFDEARLEEGCAWKGAPRKVDVTAREVAINKKTFSIRTDDERAAFARTLRACGEYRAARRFNRWQEARRKLSLSAGSIKRGMIEALVTDEPKRKPKPAG